MANFVTLNESFPDGSRMDYSLIDVFINSVTLLKILLEFYNVSFDALIRYDLYVSIPFCRSIVILE